MRDGTEPQGNHYRIAGASDGLGAWQPTQHLRGRGADECLPPQHREHRRSRRKLSAATRPPTRSSALRNNVTRGQMAAVLVRAIGCTDDGGGNLFTDDDGSRSSKRTSTSCARAGVTSAATRRTTPGSPPTQRHRGQMAAFLVRAMGYTDDGGGNLSHRRRRLDLRGGYRQVGDGGRLTLGCNPPDNANFCPANIVTRQQMAAFLVRALSLPAVP